MIARHLASVLLAAGLSQAALAQGTMQQEQPSTSAEQQNQTTTPTLPPNHPLNQAQQQSQPLTSAENTQSPGTVPQQVRAQLTSAGFSDVNVVPGSVVVTARDRGGRPVMMRITPNSMFFLTEIAAVGAPRASAGTGQANESTGQTSDTTGQNPAAMTTGAARAESNDGAQQSHALNSAENAQASGNESAQASGNTPQSLRARLTSAGFSDVNIVPSSLIITARDQGGRPLMMRVTPTSMVLLTEIPAVESSTTGTGRGEFGNTDQNR